MNGTQDSTPHGDGPVDRRRRTRLPRPWTRGPERQTAAHRVRLPLRVRLRRTRGRRLRLLAGFFVALTVALCGAALLAYHLTDIPKPHPETVMQSSVFLDGDGTYLGRRGPVDRQDVRLEDVPRPVQDAVIAAENRSFRTDAGVSPLAIARAVGTAARGGARQGGSTITQQYVKNALLSSERSLSRKAREALIAIKLDRTQSKDDILEGYLNTVYFGRGSAGIQSAARSYFGGDARDLTLSQGAALAAVINIPSYYEKAGADRKVTARLEQRWEWTLDAMAAGGDITARERADARFPAFRHYPPGASGGQQQYLIDAASKEAADRLGITEDQLARDGYTVHTTFDLALQDEAADLLAQHPGGENVHLRAAAVAIEPGDGAVRLLYGGSDYARQPFNDALDGTVEAGTALGPFDRVPLKGPLADLQRSAALNPLALSSAFGALAAEGTHAAPYVVARVTKDGDTVYTARPEKRRAVDQADLAPLPEPEAREERRAAHRQSPTVADARGCSTGGAGGGTTRRTVWWNGYDSQLSLSVALFADRPGPKKNTRRPAFLPTSPAPANFATDTAESLWATAGGAKRLGKCR